MSLALKWGTNEDPDNSGFIYFDATTAYTQSYTGQVSKHPIGGGGKVSDHFVKDNPTITISAIITGVDVSTGTYLIQDIEGNFPFNANQAPNAVSVSSTDDSVLTKLIPNSIGQFLPEDKPTVVMDSTRANVIEQIRDALKDLVSGERVNSETFELESNVQIVQLYEYNERNLINRIINNLVITSIKFKEDTNTGYALYCDITFEQVTFVPLKKTTLPQDVIRPVQKKVAPKKSVGKCDSTVKDSSSASNTDPQSKKDKIDDSVDDTDPEKQTRLGGGNG